MCLSLKFSYRRITLHLRDDRTSPELLHVLGSMQACDKRHLFRTTPHDQRLVVKAVQVKVLTSVFIQRRIGRCQTDD